MNAPVNFDNLDVGYDIPAVPGMSEADIQTPCLILDLDALERNIKKMGDYAKAHGMRHRVHGKMHKSVDVAKLQETLAGHAAFAARRSQRPRSSPAVESRTFWCQTRSAIRPRSTAWPACPNWAHAQSAASTCLTTWLIFRQRRSSMAPQSNVWWKSTVAQADVA